MNKFLKIFNSKWNPFGNYDDPIPPEKYFEKYGWFAYPYWYFVRNPFHNFCRYWIGTGNYPAAWKVWHPKRKWNLILPFFSYKERKLNFILAGDLKAMDLNYLGYLLEKGGVSNVAGFILS